MEMIGYIIVDSKKVLTACDEYLSFIERKYETAKEQYIQNLMTKKYGFLWDKRYYTREEAENMWIHGSGDDIYSPSQLQKFKGITWTDKVKELRILALNSNTVIVSNKMSFLFS